MIDPADPDFDSTPAASDRPTFTYRSTSLNPETFLTIVTPFVGDRQLFADTARSIQTQSFQEWEWLVIADARRDAEARQTISEYGIVDSRIRFVRDSRAAVSEARSDFILQIAAGDLLEPTAAEKWLWFLISHPTHSCVDSFRVSLSDKQLTGPGDFPGPFVPENLAQWAGVLRRELLLSRGTFRRATLREYLHWSGRTGESAEPLGDASTGRGARLLGKRGALELKVPFRNELAKPKRRLLMVVPFVTTGGADKFNIDLVSQLSQRAWEITLVTTLSGDNSWLPRIGQLTPDVFALPDLVAPTDYPRFMRYLIGSRRPDVILISNSLFAYAALPYLRRVADRVPIVDYCHSVVEEWLDGGYPKLSVERQDCLDLHITSSAALKQWMVGRGGNAERIEVCYIGTAQHNGRQPLSRSELGLPEEGAIVMYPCRITHEKQPAVFAKTLLELRRRGRRFHALVVGDGPYLDWLRTFARRHSLEESVNFLGYQPNERLRELMSVADCVFLPSKFEGISAVLYEAMAEGVPVVGADVGGQRELVAPECGVLISPDGEEEEVLRYTDALVELIDDPDRRRRMGEAAGARIRAHFTLDRMGDRMNALLEHAGERVLSTALPVPAEEEARKAALEAVRVASWEVSSIGPMSWRIRHVLFRALSMVGMPVYRLGVRMGMHWLQPLKDRVFRVLFPPAH